MLSTTNILTENHMKTAKKLYICGPTVYSDSHIGHARCYMVVDLLYRIMTYLKNENIYLVMNITDIDDKIIKKAIETKTPWLNVSKAYEKLFFDALARLNIQKPNIVIRVSECIPQIIAYIQKIMDNGFAYPTSDGSVYFDSVAYENAGYNFGKNDADIEEHCSKVDVKVILLKKNRRDFALWKGRPASEALGPSVLGEHGRPASETLGQPATRGQGRPASETLGQPATMGQGRPASETLSQPATSGEPDVGFEAEFTYQNEKIKLRGRPGWHIECSCMIDETLGSRLDIHLGGIDLKFPHHHNENLQANAYYHPLYLSDNTQWCDTFMHVGHVCVDGKKMAKSMNNYVTIGDALREINANQLRWMFISHKWQDPFEYSDETINHAKIFDATIKNFFNRIVNYPFNNYDVKYSEKEFTLEEYFNRIKVSILASLEDFELEIATRLFAELINKANAYTNLEHPNEHLVKKICTWISNILTILGFKYENNHQSKDSEIISVLIETRTALRNLTRDKTLPADIKKKLFEILDAERNVKLKDIGITLLDTKESSSWHVTK